MILATFLCVMAAAIALACLARLGHHEKDPRSFFAAHSQFGPVLYFMLSVGETYSIGTVLGFPGGIMTGGPNVALWFIGYIILAFPIGFILYPMLWNTGRKTGAITLPDLFRGHFSSRALERFVSAFLLLLTLPFGTMQFIGLSTVLNVLLPGVPPVTSALLAGALAFAFVAIAGMRAAALISILKDGLMLGAILVVATLALLHWNHNPTHTLANALAARTHNAPNLSFILSTILLQSVGFCIVPQTAAAVFSARSTQSIRKAQVWMPLYMLLFPFLLAIAGYAMTHTAEHTGNDATFLTVARSLTPDWLLGLILGGVALTALVWLGSVCLSLAAIVTRNLLPDIPVKHQKRTGLLVIALYLALSITAANLHTVPITALNTLFYLCLIQLLPAIITIILNIQTSIRTIITAVLSGLILALTLRETNVPLAGINPALIALTLNILIITLGASSFAKRKTNS